MHLTFFIPDLRGGGAQHMTVNLANEFARRGYRVDLLLVQKKGPYADKVSKDVNVVDLGKKRMMNALGGIGKYLRTERPDVVVSALAPANVLILAARMLSGVSQTKIIVTERNYFSLRSKENRGFLGRFLPFLVRRFYPYADKISGISKGVAEDIKTVCRLSDDRVTWVHNPVVTKETLRLLEEDARDPWFAESRMPVIVCSGRLVAQKDYDTMLRALAAMKTKARLLILGDGPLRQDIEALADSLGVAGRVHMKGFVDNPLAYMKRCDLFALSSRWEGFGNVIVEALLCGLPIVATDCKAGPAEILDGGEYGALVAVGDAEAFAQAMDRALAGPPDSGRQKHRAMHFTVENSADRYEAVISEVAGGRA